MLSFFARIRLYVIRAVLYGFLRFLALFVKVDPHLIMFCSFNGRSYSDNPRYLFEYLRDKEKKLNYRFVWAFEKTRDIDGAEAIKFNSLKYYYLLSKAKYWVFNAKMAPYYYKKASQVYIQTWHGTPLKHLGHDLVDNGRTYYRSRQSYKQMIKGYDRDSRHWDYLLSSNPFSSDAFTTAFDFSQEKILEVGYPRVDYLVNTDVKEIKKIKERYGVPTNKKIILYAPTWRDDFFGVGGYNFELVVDFKKWRDYLGEEIVVLFKPHYLISNQYQVPDNLTDFVIVLGADADINDAYLMSDLLITDYSSVFFDYAVLGRPIYFYMYDFEHYQRELHGFYLDIRAKLPNDVARTEEELLKDIKATSFDFERLKSFNQEFNFWNDGHASARIVERIFYED